jgi:allantoin racemase
MRLIVIPPYRAQNYTPGEGHYMVRELLTDMREKGQLDGVEVDIDDGYPVEDATGNRDEEVFALISAGTFQRVKMYSEGDRYDAIVTSGGIEPGFDGARVISKIPVTGSVSSAVHLASLIGDRFSVIYMNDPSSFIVRRLVRNYGLDHKLISVRSIGHSSNSQMAVIRKYKKGERGKAPEGKRLLDDTVARCIAAIEEDRVDSLIFACPHPQCLQEEIAQMLEEAGYGEIQLIGGFRAAVEMAKAMVNMKLRQAARAYPSDSLKATPRFA